MARASSPWSRLTPALRASAGLHAAALGAVAVEPTAWPWAAGAVIANHAGIAAAGLWPRSALLGPNVTRLPDASRARGEVAVTLDDGPDPEVTPQALRILADAGVRASFFAVGERLRRHPELGREILRQGHGLENHSDTHGHAFSMLGPRGMEREIAGAQRTIGELGGAARFFRAPAGLRNPFLDPQLRRHDLRLVSWTRRGFDTVSRDTARVTARLCRGLAAGDILLLHDGHAARTVRGRPVALEVLPRVLDACRRANLRPVPLHAALD